MERMKSFEGLNLRVDGDGDGDGDNLPHRPISEPTPHLQSGESRKYHGRKKRRRRRRAGGEESGQWWRSNGGIFGRGSDAAAATAAAEAMSTTTPPPPVSSPASPASPSRPGAFRIRPGHPAMAAAASAAGIGIASISTSIQTPGSGMVLGTGGRGDAPPLLSARVVSSSNGSESWSSLGRNPAAQWAAEVHLHQHDHGHGHGHDHDHGHGAANDNGDQVGNGGAEFIVATAERDSLWKLLKRSRRVQALLGASVAALFGLAVGLSLALSDKSSSSSSPSNDTTESFWASRQIPPNLDGSLMKGDFGASVSMNRDGTRMAIASPAALFPSEAQKHGGVGNVQNKTYVRRGLVSVYNRTDTGWQLMTEIRLSAIDEVEHTLPVSGGGTNLLDVHSDLVVALSRDGLKLAVGAPFHDLATGNKTNVGLAELYGLDENTGEWLALAPPLVGTVVGEYFGASVSLSEDGEVMAVGAPGGGGGNISGMDRSGVATAYLLNNGAWLMLGSTNIVGSTALQELGGSVSLSANGHVLAVGSSTTPGGSAQVAMAYRFRAGSWVRIGSGIKNEEGGRGKSADDKSANRFVTSYQVALSADGTKIVVSNRYSLETMSMMEYDVENAGLYVRAYILTSDAWSPIGDNLHANSPGEKSGYYISLSDDGNIIAMGDPGRRINTDGKAGHAHVYVYDKDSNGYTQMGPDINGQNAGDLFGYDVAISGDGRFIAAGSPANRGSGFELGRMAVYSVP